MTVRSPEQDEPRILRRLSVRGARLAGEGDGSYRLCVDGGRGSTWRIAAATVDTLSARGLVEEGANGLMLSDIGRALVRRSLAATDAYRAQHLDLARTTVSDDDGVLQQVSVNRDESPLAWLRRRSGRDGRPLIDAAEFTAGERLRSDYTRGRLMPRVTANWSAAVAGHRRDGGAGGMAELTEAAIGARRRVERALAAVGPELGGLLVDFCCFLKGLEEIERERGWPARSAKIVLRLGLVALVRHYGLSTRARGPRRARMVHWGAADYRPTIE